MQKGFLVSPKRNASSDKAQKKICSIKPDWKPPEVPSGSAEQVSPDKLDSVLQLLAGPSDEKRFVGLLLVTRLLPAGDQATIRRVYNALGSTFLSRLLLPLRGSGDAPAGPPAADNDASQKQAAMCGLAMAVLSGFARVPELAASEELLENIPLFLKVARAGGVSAVLSNNNNGGGLVDTLVNPDGEAETVRDALECVLAAAQSSEEGRVVAVESGALVCCGAVLLRSPGDQQGQALAVRLVSWILGQADRADVVEESQQELGTVVAGLCALLAAPAALVDADRASEVGRQSALLQLEALHALLLLLPPPVPAAAALADELRTSARRPQSWASDARTGLSLLLRGRLPAVQRHSALALAAAVADLAGPEWMLGPVDPPSVHKNGKATTKSRAGPVNSFLQLVVEVNRIETALLLRDATFPEEQVPAGSEPRAAAAEWRAPQPRGGHSSDEEEEDDNAEVLPMEVTIEEIEGDSEGEDEKEESAEVGPIDMESMRRVLESSKEEESMREQMAVATGEGTIAAASPESPASVAPDEQLGPADDGPTEPAWRRAERVLPACFSLLESSVDALVLDEEEIENGEEEAGNRGCRNLSSQRRPMRLPDEVAERAMRSLRDSLEVVLQYLEEEQQAWYCNEREGEQSMAPREGSVVLRLAALRALGRFCADAPGAFAAQLRALLPFLLSLKDGDANTSGPHQQQVVSYLPGVAFLLPTLVQVSATSWVSWQSSEGAEDAEAWATALAEPRAFSCLASHLVAALGSCPLDHGARGQAMQTCRVILNVLGRRREAPVLGQEAMLMREAAASLLRPLATVISSPPAVWTAIPPGDLEAARLAAVATALLAMLLQGGGTSALLSPDAAGTLEEDGEADIVVCCEAVFHGLGLTLDSLQDAAAEGTAVDGEEAEELGTDLAAAAATADAIFALRVPLLQRLCAGSTWPAELARSRLLSQACLLDEVLAGGVNSVKDLVSKGAQRRQQ